MTEAVARVQANPLSSDKAQAIAGHVRAKQFTSYIAGKRCIVVGPAGYLAGQGRGEWIDSHDVVVKMNWGETLDAADYGRTDVLFKRLLKLGHADDILVQEYVEAGVQWLVGIGTRPHDKGIGYLQEMVGERVPWFVDDATRASLRRELGTSPLLGMVTIKYLLEHGAASVAVTGCDFYRTGYASEYGGERYRRIMKRGEGTLGVRHDGPSQLRWLTHLRDTDSRVTFDQELSALVQPAPRPRRTKRAARNAPPKGAARFVWTPRNVTTRRLPAMSLRTYVEQRMLRGILEPLALSSAAEVGAGFGRMTIVLADHADAVTAFEREPEMAKVAARLLPAVNVVNVETLTKLPAVVGAFDLVMTFTVLQHMDHEAVARVTAEMQRTSARYCLIVEDTDPDHVYIDRKDRSHFTFGRSVEEYQRLMAPLELIRSEPREVEAGFSYQGKPRPYVGHYMLFERRAA